MTSRITDLRFPDSLRTLSVCAEGVTEPNVCKLFRGQRSVIGGHSRRGVSPDSQYSEVSFGAPPLRESQ